MDYAEEAIELTRPLITEKIVTHPLIGRMLGSVAQPLTRSNYAAFLIEIVQLIKHTPHYLTLASSWSVDDRWMCDWWMDFAVDERGHDQLCFADLRRLGVPQSEVTAAMPGIGVTAMVALNYRLAQTDPVALIGFAMATEGMGSGLATRAAKHIDDNCAFGAPVTTFLRVHGAEDVEHYQSVMKAFNQYAQQSANLARMLHTWKYTIHNYSQLFSDVLARGDDWLEPENERISEMTLTAGQ